MIETYEYEGPKCPHCAQQYTADEAYYFDESNFTDMDCDECGKPFKVRVYTSTSWTCWVDPAPPAPAAPLDAQPSPPESMTTKPRSA